MHSQRQTLGYNINVKKMTMTLHGETKFHGNWHSTPKIAELGSTNGEIYTFFTLGSFLPAVAVRDLASSAE
jgi:hypothetical protein